MSTTVPAFFGLADARVKLRALLDSGEQTPAVREATRRYVSRLDEAQLAQREYDRATRAASQIH